MEFGLRQWVRRLFAQTAEFARSLSQGSLAVSEGDEHERPLSLYEFGLSKRIQGFGYRDGACEVVHENADGLRCVLLCEE
jgi:hypothetical protein